MTIKTFVAALAALALVVPSLSYAQEEPMAPTAPTDPVTLPSCFDYYRFGSTPMTLASELTAVAQGGTIELSGTLENENAYELSDVTVYAKVLHVREPDIKDSYGPDVIAWFPVAEDLVLAPGKTMPITFSYTVPRNAKPGTYQVVTYVAAHDRFNMLGLSFTNDVVGGTYRFTVLGEDVGWAIFDVTKSTVSGLPYYATAFAPRLEVPSAGTPATFTLRNNSQRAVTGVVRYSLYSWDSLLPKNRIASSEEQVTVPSGAERVVSYEIPASDRSVYFLVAEFDPEGPNNVTSIATLRLVNGRVSEPRLNFVGLTGAPGAEETQAFTCFHATGMRQADGVRVTLDVYPTNPIRRLLAGGSLIAKTYEGAAPGAIVALAEDLPKTDGPVVVRAKLWQGGELLDEVAVTYGCAKGSCGSDWLPIAGFTLLALLLLGIAVAILRRPRTPKAPPVPLDVPPVV